jgi:F-box-like
MKKFSPRRFLQLALQARFLHRLRGKKVLFSKLPEELLVYIFEFLSIQDLCSVVAVNQAWRAIGFDGYLWKTQSLNYFENPINRSERKLPGKQPDEDWKTYFRRRYEAHSHWRSNNFIQTTITGHVGTVWTLAFDDSKLVTGSFDKTIKVSLSINFVNRICPQKKQIIELILFF